MQIQPLTLANLVPSTGSSASASPGAGSTSFEGVLGQTLQTLSSSQRNADQHALNLATGKDVNLVDTVLAMEQTTLDFKLAMQVRDKVIEAYQDVMRTQV